MVSYLKNVECGVVLSGWSGYFLFLGYGMYSYIKCRSMVRTACIFNRKWNIWKTSGKVKIWECDCIPWPVCTGNFLPASLYSVSEWRRNGTLLRVRAGASADMIALWLIAFNQFLRIIIAHIGLISAVLICIILRPHISPTVPVSFPTPK